MPKKTRRVNTPTFDREPEIRCELDYLHGELYFLLQQLRSPMNLCDRNKHNGL